MAVASLTLQGPLSPLLVRLTSHTPLDLGLGHGSPPVPTWVRSSAPPGLCSPVYSLCGRPITSTGGPLKPSPPLASLSQHFPSSYKSLNPLPLPFIRSHILLHFPRD